VGQNCLLLFVAFLRILNISLDLLCDGDVGLFHRHTESALYGGVDT
jgi:hypothetical protein